MDAITEHIERISDKLQGYGSVHPASNGRVITLNPPYNLPSGMDLRGIAGVVLKKKPDTNLQNLVNSWTAEERKGIARLSGRFKDGQLTQERQMGPHLPPPFDPPDLIKHELTILSEAFQRLAGVTENRIWFPNSPAQSFHIDGSATERPSWRLTFALNDLQSEWHTYQRSATTPVQMQGMTGFPQIPPEHQGQKDLDYFGSGGALMFRTNSSNGLFHRTPLGINDNRFMVTLDASASVNADCTQRCPFPCRKPF